MLEYHTSKFVVTVQRAFRCKVRKGPAYRQDHSCTARIIVAVKNIDAHMLTRVWQELEYRIDACRVTRGAHIEHL
jgi:hypothetical protein